MQRTSSRSLSSSAKEALRWDKNALMSMERFEAVQEVLVDMFCCSDTPNVLCQYDEHGCIIQLKRVEHADQTKLNSNDYKYSAVKLTDETSRTTLYVYVGVEECVRMYISVAVVLFE